LETAVYVLVFLSVVSESVFQSIAKE